MAKEIAAIDIKIEDYHFDYLEIQVGEIQHFAADKRVWYTAYRESLRRRYESIKNHLPIECESILDIGSGLGGIDVVLSQHYDGVPEVCLMDGLDDAPRVRAHSQTFNNMSIAMDFQRVNGVKKVTFMEALAYSKTTSLKARKFDLIVSFQSYCFHYEPALYLAFVRACCHDDTVLIFDVRKEKSQWHKTLLENFERIAIVHEGKKFERWLMICRN